MTAFLLLIAPVLLAQTSAPTTMVIAPLSASDIASLLPKKQKAKPVGGMAEGKPLETMLWSGGGAIIGSVAGPPGAIIGAGIGAIAGLLVAVFVVPHNGPDEAELAARKR